jgi:hypothetical protein
VLYVVADHVSTTVALVVLTLVVAVPIRASVSVTEPAVNEPEPIDSAANVGLDVVAIDCGRDSVTDPVDADAVIWSAVPARLVTPTLVIVRISDVDAYDALIPVPPVTAPPNVSIADVMSAVNATVPESSLNVIVLSAVGFVTVRVVS